MVTFEAKGGMRKLKMRSHERGIHTGRAPKSVHKLSPNC